MAFYKDTKRVTKQEKRSVAEARGGFEDEGSEYSGQRGGRSNSRGYQGNRSNSQGGGYQGNRPSSRGGGYQGNRSNAPQGERGGYQGNRSNAPQGERGGYQGNRSNAPQGERGGYQGNRSNAPQGERGGYQGNRSNAPQGERGGYQGNRSNAPQGERGGYQGTRSNAPQGERGGYQGNRSNAPQGERGGYQGNRSNAPQGERGGYQGNRSNYQGERSGYQGNRGNQGGYQGNRDGGEQKRYGNAPTAPMSFRDSTRATPQGERPAPGRAPRFDRKGGNYRFAPGAPSRYTERGDRMTPRPYNEQRQARMEGENRYDSYRYDAQPVKPAPAAYDAPMGEEADLVPNENLLSGRNPIREALKSGRDIEKLLVARGELSGSAREIVQMAKERHIPVQEVDRVRLDDITHNHQGMLAFASAYQYSTVEAMLELAKERGEEPFLVLLDGITDPHNLGAIIRSAECAGAHGVIVQERRAVGLTPAAVKASAGAVEHLPVARVTNLTNTIQVLKAQNIWAYAADMKGEDYSKVDFSGAVALIIGAEGEGVSRRVLETCDKKISIPVRGKLDSLNASVAAGILLYAVIGSR